MEKVYRNSKVAEAYKVIVKLSNGISEYLWSHEAWGVMLVKQGVIKKEHAPDIFKALLELEDPEIGNKSENRNHRGVEAYVIEKAGSAVAGNLSVGRTTISPYLRMQTRLPFLGFMGGVIELMGNLLSVSERFKDCIMPGYTHLAHAQPTTLGHYLLSVFDPVFRVFEQMELAYRHLNMDELGCGALAGTSWPIDRNMSAELLGFDGIIENANDAVSISDCFVFAASTLANLMSILSRFSQDLNYWATAEFDFLDVPRALMKSSHSYMMPQKTAKNNGDLEDLRIASANATGCLMATVSNASRTSHADMHEMIYMHRPLLGALQESGSQVYRLGRNIEGIKANRERMLEMAKKGFSCATELANNIVRKYDIDYRTAHDIVNVFVNDAIAERKTAEEVDSAMLDRTSMKSCGKKLNMPDDQLRLSLDPVNFVESHNSQGGVNPGEVARMIRERMKKIDIVSERHLERAMRLKNAQSKLKLEIEKIIDGTAI